MVRAASGLRRTVRLWSVRYASSCWRTALSVFFDQKERMKKGRKFFQIIWAKRHFIPEQVLQLQLFLKLMRKYHTTEGILLVLIIVLISASLRSLRSLY